MTGKHRHVFTERRKALAAKTLAQKIGYLKANHFLSFPDLPTQAFNAHKIIRPENQLFVIQNGVVEIWYTSHDLFVTALKARSLFGDMPLLGQTMLGCRAIAGAGGVMLGVMDFATVTEFINANSINILREIGPRFACVEVDYYRTTFQTVDSRLAGLLLDLAGEESAVEGLTQQDLAEQLATYRETVTNAMDALREDGLIEIGRKRITLLNKKGLKEFSEL